MKNHVVLIFAIFAIMAVSVSHTFCQASSDVYIIGTAAPITTQNPVALLKWTSKTLYSNDLGYSMTFIINAPERGYSININHYNRKNKPKKIVEMEQSNLSSLDVVKVEDFIAAIANKEQAIAWMRTHVGKRIWVIDRNDFFYHGETPMMKLIETTVNAEQLPSNPTVIIEDL